MQSYAHATAHALSNQNRAQLIQLMPTHCRLMGTLSMILILLNQRDFAQYLSLQH